MSDSIFTRIIRKEVPCHKVYEDEKTIVFMDINPIQPGHVLVVTKTEVPTFLDLSDEDAAAFWQTIRLVSSRLKQMFPDKKRIGLMIEGLDVDHVHASLFPFDTSQEYRNVPRVSEPDHKELAEVAKKLAF